MFDADGLQRTESGGSVVFSPFVWQCMHYLIKRFAGKSEDGNCPLLILWRSVNDHAGSLAWPILITRFPIGTYDFTAVVADIGFCRNQYITKIPVNRVSKWPTLMCKINATS
ncbi:hypothetical protein [Edaphobacter modestus]|uniref:hypothetical protein n=1 Tax=Edaphobacter modestus TaxID=388466 RepID=UPI00102C7F68|nr:hypothetical protein [Edaphobacter modestus]